jgi:hypothetical protein
MYLKTRSKRKFKNIQSASGASLPSGMQSTCPCGWVGVRLNGHYHNSPTCRPAAEATSDSDEESLPKVRKSDPWTSAHAALSKRMHKMRCKDLMSLAHIGLAVELAEELATTILSMWARDCDAVTKETYDICNELKSVSTVVSRVSAELGALVPVDRPLLADSKTARKRFACLSLTQQIVQMLVESKPIRTHCRKSSSFWKSGALLKEQPIMRDRTHGLRFRRSRSARVALASHVKRFRIALTDWSDEWTVRSL